MTNTIPYFFGPEGRRLFGWFYPPQGASGARQAAIVLCQPVGHEYMYAYRAFRVLAEQLAGEGFPVLRFDYRGIGDASGDPYGPHQVSEWRESLKIAIAELRARAENLPVVIVGLRLGALFGALAARDDDGIDGMVLWDPCVTGKSYIRQIKMLAAMSAQPSNHPSADAESGYTEALGYVLTPEMIRDLQALDLQKAKGPFPKTLLVMREQNAPQGALATHLESIGTTVTRQTTDEHDAFLVTAERSVLPERALRMIVEWLTDKYPIGDQARDVDAPVGLIVNTRIECPDTQSEVFPAGYSEIPVTIDHRVFGILTTPTAGEGSDVDGAMNDALADAPIDTSVDTSKPAIVFLNMGTDHHVGPRRLHVNLSRTVAAMHGMTSLRVDLSGIGDSALPPDGRANSPYPINALDDVDTVIAYLQDTLGFDSVLLAGMCAGGYHSVHGGRRNESVVGYIAINPPIYAKPGDPITVNPFEAMDEAERLKNAIRSPSYWLKLLRGGIRPGQFLELGGRAVRMVGGRISALLRPVSGVGKSAPGGEGSEMDAMFTRAVDTHLIFDADDLGYRYLRHIAGDSLDEWKADPNFTLSVVQGATHAFMPLEGQAVLNRLVLNWIGDRYVKGEASDDSDLRADSLHGDLTDSVIG